MYFRQTVSMLQRSYIDTAAPPPRRHQLSSSKNPNINPNPKNNTKNCNFSKEFGTTKTPPEHADGHYRMAWHTKAPIILFKQV